MKNGNTVYNVLDYGAPRDGRALAHEKIQAAIDACAAGGGGVVLVPQGVYRCGTIRLKSHVELCLMHGAVLKASENLDDYNAEDEYEQNYSCADEEWRGKHLILCVEQTDVALSGDGVIDGNGGAYYGEPAPWNSYIWKDGLALSRDKEKLRPGQLVCFIECTHVRIEGVRMRNATCWGFFLHGCAFARIRGVEIVNPPTYANTDGIDIDACSDVIVQDCLIDTGDDAIAVRCAAQRLKNKEKKCENVIISHCVLASSSSVFRLGVGYGEIRHVCVSDIVVRRGGVGIHLMPSYHGQCVPILGVTFHDISMHNVSRPLDIRCAAPANICGVTLQNIRSDATAASYICSDGEKVIKDVRLENVRLTMADDPRDNEELRRKRGDVMLSCRGVDGLRLHGVTISATEDVRAKWQEALQISDCDDAVITECVKGITPPPPPDGGAAPIMGQPK